MSAAPKIRIFESDVQPVRIDELRIDEMALQSRAETDQDIVKVYADRRRGKPKQPGSPFPPVLVFIINGVWWLADGFHRVAAARKLGEETIPAIVRRAESMTEAIIAGAEINMSKENLRGYQEADRRRYAELLIRNGAGKPGEGSWDWSDSELGRRTGLGSGTIARIRLVLRDSLGISIPDRVQTFLDGSVQQIRTYKNKSSLKRAPSGAFKTSIGGKILTSTRPEAVDEFHHRRQEVEGLKKTLGKNQLFRSWLRSQMVCAIGIRAGEFVLGGTRVGSCYAAPFGDASLDPVRIAICNCVLATRHLEWANRAVAVGYLDRRGKGASCLVGLAAALNRPVEFMTPEEFVERALAGEFGETPADAAAEEGQGDDDEAEPTQ
jgi:hypothetical protein